MLYTICPGVKNIVYKSFISKKGFPEALIKFETIKSKNELMTGVRGVAYTGASFSIDTMVYSKYIRCYGLLFHALYMLIFFTFQVMGAMTKTLGQQFTAGQIKVNRFWP